METKSTNQIGNLIRAYYEGYPENDFSVKCGTVTEKFVSPNPQKAATVLAVFQTLRQNPHIWDAVFAGVEDEQAVKDLRKFAVEVMGTYAQEPLEGILQKAVGVLDTFKVPNVDTDHFKVSVCSSNRTLDILSVIGSTSSELTAQGIKRRLCEVLTYRALRSMGYGD